MPGSIAIESIEEVKQRADIVEVVSSQVVLKKRGRDYLGLCPFHGEKTPSFSVSPDKQVYYCFGCGQGGDAIRFLMETGKQSFTEVVFDLARRYQIPIKTLEPEQRQEIQRQLTLREQLYEIVAVAVSFYQHALRQPQGEKALTYLLRDRALSEETIQQFQLGYAPAGWDNLYRYLTEQKRYPVELVEQAGLIKPRQSSGGHYDVFRDRLMIPILDSQGRAIAFGSRTLANEEPKYLNSPETPLFDKGKTLFALDRAKSAIQKQDCALVVEGYFDAIALHAAGFNHAVAALGTAFSVDQLRLILRYCESKKVIFNFDADKAGVKATQRAISEIEPLVNSGQVQLRILNIPDGKDADEFLKSHDDGQDRYHFLLDTAPLWFDWQIEQLLKDKDLAQADQFQQVARQMVQLLNQLEDSNSRSYYLSYCAEKLAGGDSRLLPLHLQTLQSQIGRKQIKPSRVAPPPPPTVTDDPSEKRVQAESLLLRIYLHHPDHRPTIQQKIEEKDIAFVFNAHRHLWRQIAEIEPSEGIVAPDDLLPIPHHLQGDLDHQIETAIATIDRLDWLDYRHHYLNQWKTLDPSDAEGLLRYAQEIVEADKQLSLL